MRCWDGISPQGECTCISLPAVTQYKTPTLSLVFPMLLLCKMWTSQPSNGNLRYVPGLQKQTHTCIYLGKEPWLHTPSTRNIFCPILYPVSLINLDFKTVFTVLYDTQTKLIAGHAYAVSLFNDPSLYGSLMVHSVPKTNLKPYQNWYKQKKNKLANNFTSLWGAIKQPSYTCKIRREITSQLMQANIKYYVQRYLSNIKHPIMLHSPFSPVANLTFLRRKQSTLMVFWIHLTNIHYKICFV